MIPDIITRLLARSDGFTINPKEYASVRMEIFKLDPDSLQSEERKVQRWCRGGKLLRAERNGKLFRIHRSEVVKLVRRHYPEVKL